MDCGLMKFFMLFILACALVSIGMLAFFLRLLSTEVCSEDVTLWFEEGSTLIILADDGVEISVSFVSFAGDTLRSTD